MDAFVASHDAQISAKLRASLAQAGIQCPASRIVTHEAAKGLCTQASSDRPALIFFVAENLANGELSLLRQLAESVGRSTKIVAVGAGLGPSTILQAIRAGASDCLDMNGEVDRELRDVLHRVSAPHDHPHFGRLISVIGAVGGAGTSLIAVNLAAVLAQRNGGLGLLDLHVRGGNLAMLLKCNPRHTLLSLAAKREQLDQAMFEQCLVKHDSGIHLLASPEPFADYRSIRPELILKTIALARMAFPTVVASLEDFSHDEEVRTLAASHRIVLAMRPDFVSVCRTKKSIEFLLKAHVPRDHIVLVANRMGSPNSIEIGRIEEALEMHVDHQLPDDPGPVNASVNLGTPYVLSYPKAKVSQAMVQLAESIDGRQASPAEMSWGLRQWNRVKAAASLLSL